MTDDIKSLSKAELETLLAGWGEPAYRAGQLYKWLRGGAGTFDGMTNLSEALRERLRGEYTLYTPEVVEKQVSDRDGTMKILWRLRDGNCVESVVMRYRHGNSVCISTQVGCRMGCAFCASTLGGLVRNLTASEMEDQVRCSQQVLGERIGNVVLMGIGEPMDNFENVMRFLELAGSPEGLHIGMRHISLSTCGIVEKVDKMGAYNLQLTLSVSLHAPDDETRSKIMPINRTCGVDDLLAACRRYAEKTGRRISYEYAMIDGVNDTPEHARLLARKLRGTGSHVNLIRLNEVAERSLRPSTERAVQAFARILEAQGINVTVRRRLGRDIDAACGQLRRNHTAQSVED